VSVIPDFMESIEQRDLRLSARAFADGELGLSMIDRDTSSSFSREEWEKCARFGVFRLPIPESLGGDGADGQTIASVMEGLGEGCKDLGLLFSINAHLWTVVMPIVEFGNEDQKDRYLTGLTDGTLIGGNGSSEPGAGSDVFSMTTRAVEDGDFFVLNGSKLFTTNAPVANVFVCYATIDPQYGMGGITAFLVDRDTPGFTIGPPSKKMGLRTSPMAELAFEDCRIPKRNVVGRVGRGGQAFECSMKWERSFILASSVGTMQRRLEKCLQYANERKQFGKRIGKFQLVSSRIVDMKLRLETSRFLLHKAAWLIDHGSEPQNRLGAAMAKLYISEAFVQSGLDAVQIYGGYGYMTEFEVERELRDAIGGRLYSGTSEIQRMIIARELGL
jgi:alkylation response protein AidB-like acyl-CoA dehydrogenase